MSFPASLPSSATRPLRVVIFYADINGADRALRTVRDALRRQSEHTELDPMLWNVALLEDTAWLRLAAADVANADLCVHSTEGQVAPGSIGAWLRELAPRLARHWITLESFEASPGEPQLVRQAG